jgi:hypothetical protein
MGMPPVLLRNPVQRAPRWNRELEEQYHQYAEDHAAYLTEQRALEDPAKQPEGEDQDPIEKVRTFTQFLELHLKIVEQLVEEPMFAEPKIGEPVLEVNIVGADLRGPWPHPYLYNLQKPFARHYIDCEMVGETKPWEGDPRAPRWKSKMLVLPRKARCSQFEVLNGTKVPLVLGDCAYSTETLWTCAQRCGRYTLNSPIMYKGYQVGTVMVQVKVWDGMPIEEETASLGMLGGTLAGALDNPWMREYGPDGSRRVNSDTGYLPVPYAPAMPFPTGMPPYGMNSSMHL